MPEVWVGLGTNVGDRMANLRLALELLRSEFEVIGVSRVYETAPMYVEDQPRFLNAAVAIRTHSSPLDVLRTLKQIEAEIGRQKRERFGPREIDLDLLGYHRLWYRFMEAGSTVLEVPHPRIPERRFVLAPLHDIAPDGVLPRLGSVAEMLARTNDEADNVHLFGDALL